MTKIGRCLIEIIDKGLIWKVNKEKGFECFINADFAGVWDPKDWLKPVNVLSRLGFVITYSGIPIFLMSKLQTEIALSTCEDEYIALSTSMREVLPLIDLLKDLQVACEIITTQPVVTCKVFQDNQSCISVTESRKPPARKNTSQLSTITSEI